MPNFTLEYPNGSIAHHRGPWGTLVRLENVPRLPDERQTSFVSGKWSYDEEGNETFLGFEGSKWEDDKSGFCESDVPILNRHSFNTRESADGTPHYPGKYHLGYSELWGGWYLL